MIKAIYFVKRKTGMDLADFRTYWLNVHAPIVRRIPELRRYVQSHTIESGYRSREPIYDGVAELWYEDTGAMRRTADSAASMAAAEDDARFLDMTRFSFIITEERVHKDQMSRPGMPKVVSFLKRKRGTDVASFQTYWMNTHGPLVTRIPQLRRYVQCHVRASAYRDGRTPIYDGVAETWFDDLDAMRACEKTAEYLAVRADEPNFLARVPVPFIIAREHMIV